MPELFHLFSNGAATADIFITSEDKDDALNRIAVVAYISGVEILAFDIEDTHLHIFATGKFDNILKFKFQYQKRTRDYLTRTRDDAQFMKFSMEISRIESEDYAKRAAAYVICQATKDGKKILPYDYRWSSASLYFRNHNNDQLWTLTENSESHQINEVSGLSLNYLKRRFRITFRLPDRWKFCNGIILPSSFVNIPEFEKIFRTHNTFRVFCGGSAAHDKDTLDSMALRLGVELDEKEAKELASQYSCFLFGKRSVRTLNVMQRIELARMLRQKIGIGIPQIARRVYLPESEVRKAEFNLTVQQHYRM